MNTMATINSPRLGNSIGRRADALSSKVPAALRASAKAAPAPSRATFGRAATQPARAALSLATGTASKAKPAEWADSLNAVDKIPGKPRVVVLGSGWGAISMVKSLPEEVAAKYDIILVSPRNFFLYTPLLPAVATGTVEERSIVEPVRNVLAGKGRYFEAGCTQVMPDSKEIVACFPADAGFPEACFKVPYDVLIASVGSVNNTFGTPGVEENSYYFKSIEDAKRLRGRVSECFERASLPATTREEAEKLLSFVIVGGGPTGVEVAAELYDMVNEDLVKLYPELSRLVKIKVIELQDHVLSAYDRAIGSFTADFFGRAGVELVLNTKVQAVEDGFVRVCRNLGTDNEVCEEIEFGACVWATGVKMNPLTEQLAKALPEGSQTNFRGLVTDEWLRVKGSNGSIYAMGDGATIEQARAIGAAEALFAKYDTNGDGELGIQELRSLMDEASKEYPHLGEFARMINGKDRFGGLVKKFIKNRPSLPKVGRKEKLTQDEFAELLQSIDSNLRGLPPTAQVAAQQGKYMATVLSSAQVDGDADDLADSSGVGNKVKSFDYSHKGAMAYVGGGQGVVDLPVAIQPLVGIGAGVLWKSYETLGQVSFRNQCLVATDWVRAKVFGRDISRF